MNVRLAKNRSLPYLRASAMLALLLIPIVASAQAIPETPNILTNIMNNFLGVFSGGFVRLLPWAKTLMIILATIEIVWAALYWAMEGENFLPQLLQKIMVIGITGWLVLTWPALCKTVMDGFIGAGAMAGNGAGGAAVPDLRDPSQVLNVFWTLAQPIADYTSTLGIMDIGKIILVGFGYIILAVAIFIIAIQCALTYLEFYVVAVLATVLVPFGINKHMSFLAEKSFGAVISHGIKLAVLSFILTAAAPVLQNILTPGGANAITYNLIFNLDAAALLIAFLAWHGPSIAAGLFGGGPALHAGAVARAGGSGAFMLGRMLGSASGRGAGGTGSIGQVRKAAGAIGSGVGTAALALTGAGGAVAGAARGGAALAGVAGAGRAGQAAAGVVGVARIASGAAVNAGRSTATAAVSPVKRATSALKASWQSGQVAGAVGSGAASQWPRRG